MTGHIKHMAQTDEPSDPLTRIADAATDAMTDHPEWNENMRGIALIFEQVNDPNSDREEVHSGIAMTEAYQDDGGRAFADVMLTAETFARLMGLRMRVLGADPDGITELMP